MKLLIEQMWLLKNDGPNGLQCPFLEKEKKRKKKRDWYHREKIIYAVAYASSWAFGPGRCWRQNGARGTLGEDHLMVGLAPQWSPSCPSQLNHSANQNSDHY